METLNESFPQSEPGRGKRQPISSHSTKVLTIAVLVVLLMVPMLMIENMISERGDTQSDAIDEVSRKWSLAQTISGPYLQLSQNMTRGAGEEPQKSTRPLLLLPDRLNIDGELRTEILSRGIYKVNVYQAELTLKGSFSAEELQKSRIDPQSVQLDQAVVCLSLTDMRGLGEQVSIALGDSTYIFEPGLNSSGTGIHTIVDLSPLREGRHIPYEIHIRLKGSQSLYFTPLGKTTQVSLKANWSTPSFDGNFLPEQREVSEQDFSAQWQVLHLNRNYPQVFANQTSINIADVKDSAFGVNLRIPIEQYQQSMRSAKYAILIILLTFTTIFFTEILKRTRIHALQYLLVGLALCLFYSLLLSLSEHIGFSPAYLLASALTIGLIGGYMRGIIGRRQPALVMSSLLGVLYTYIFILIQLETFALLAGSLGLFVILALVMYFSKKIDWFHEA